MFLIMVSYKEPIEIIDQYLVEHRAYLEEGYKKDFFVVSGPRNPRSGGVIISQLKDREHLDKILQNDPFYIHNLADYEVIEFLPVKYHHYFKHFVE